MIVRKVHPAQEVRDDHRAPLDGVRALAFLGVFAFHANSSRFAAGALGVTVFFVLSGFLITRILLKNEGPSLGANLRVFYIRRALRILPLYYAVVLTLHVLGCLEVPWLTYLHVYNLGVYTRGEFIGSYGHFWSLAVEEQFYLIFPVLLLVTPMRLRPGLLAVLLLACAASRHLMERYAPGPFVGVLPNVASEYLLAGAVAGWLDRVRPGVRASRLRFGLALLASAWVVLRAQGLPVGDTRFWPEVAALAFAVLIWEIWRMDGPIAAALSARPLAFLGRISYGCYMLHVFALRLTELGLRSLGASEGSPLLMMRTPLALAATIAAASASWHLLESPFLRLKGRFGYASRAPGPGNGGPERSRDGRGVRASGRDQSSSSTT